MRTIDYASQFKRDYKGEKKGRHREVLDDVLMLVVELLASDSLLELKYCDHALSGGLYHREIDGCSIPQA
ncbi:type II toxin-antitoxin system mRNA interferase toxin, RelE/StbE family [Photorhabdus sp. P32]|uniref:type II toxin-antitoxin system mRNA interferase toxin, RelE/StbE family n=1 Tax=Photorhabdus sp. P32 TaxID=3117549 RepID=UPI00311B43AA